MTTVAEDWVVRERVPVLDECEVERIDLKTQKPYKIKITAKMLTQFADARNQKISETGDESPIIIGHTDLRKGVPEWLQPPIVGYADNYEVGTHPKTGRATLFARHKFYSTSTVGGEELPADEIMRRYPRRSPEAFVSDRDVDCISLLGATSPERYLGLLRMSKEVAMEPEAPAQMEAPQGDRCDQLIAALAEVLEQFAGGGAEMEPASPTGPNDAAPAPAQFAAACGPTNAALPEQEKLRMSREQESIRVGRLEAELKALRTEREQEKLQLRSERYERRLTQLEAENFDLNRAQELEDMLAMTEAQAEKQFGRIQTQYRRIGSPTFLRTADVQEGGARVDIFTETPEMVAAEKHMLKHPGMMFTDALAAVRINKVG